MIEIYAGAVDESFDFQVDENMSTDDAIRSACEMIAKKCNVDTGDAASVSALYDPAAGAELDKSKSLKDNNVTNGKRLILV